MGRVQRFRKRRVASRKNGNKKAVKERENQESRVCKKPREGLEIGRAHV